MTYSPSTNFQAVFCTVLLDFYYFWKMDPKNLYTPLHTHPVFALNFLIWIPISSWNPQTSQCTFLRISKYAERVFRNKQKFLSLLMDVKGCCPKTKKKLNWFKSIELFQGRRFEPFGYESGHENVLLWTI